MRTPQDFHCSGATRHNTDLGTEMICSLCPWSWIAAFGRNPRLLQMMKTSLQALWENRADRNAIRKIQGSLWWENSGIYTLNVDVCKTWLGCLMAHWYFSGSFSPCAQCSSTGADFGKEKVITELCLLVLLLWVGWVLHIYMLELWPNMALLQDRDYQELIGLWTWSPCEWITVNIRKIG